MQIAVCRHGSQQYSPRVSIGPELNTSVLCNRLIKLLFRRKRGDTCWCFAVMMSSPRSPGGISTPPGRAEALGNPRASRCRVDGNSTEVSKQACLLLHGRALSSSFISTRIDQPAPRCVCVCVFFTLNRSSTRRHPAHPVSVLILHPRKISSVVM